MLLKIKGSVPDLITPAIDWTFTRNIHITGHFNNK